MASRKTGGKDAAARAAALSIRRSCRRFVAGSFFLVSIVGVAPALGGPQASGRGDLSSADLARVLAVTRPADDFSSAEAHEALSGGAATSRSAPDLNAFTHPDANLDDAGVLRFRLGRALFKKLWASSPSSTQASDGLGPLFSARSCQSCHLHEGRGHPPEPDRSSASFFFRLARPAATSAEKQALADRRVLNFPDPVYGAQFQDQAVAGLRGEGTVAVTYTLMTVTLAGGETVDLRVPRYSVEGLGYGPLDPATALSPRIAQSLPGMGLLEAIPDADILANADPDDRDGDGISGRANLVRDHRTGELAIGRFGWKAQNATVRDQTSSALSSDIGISSPDAPDAYGDCTIVQTACRAMPNGVQPRLGDTEAPDPVLALLTAYTETLAVPARRDVDDPDVLAGKALFYRSGCIACHTPKFVTRRDAANPGQAFQLIWPYSDLLLHDMGEGLADHQQVGLATGREWRTAPLWGIGLTSRVSGREAYLHDGRARTLQEAILWHGGEAQRTRDAYAAMERGDRQKLLKFLESL